MRSRLTFGLVLTLAGLFVGNICCVAADTDGHLVIIGGGSRPTQMMERIVELGGGKDSRFIIIPVASSEPVETAEYQREQLLSSGAGDVDVLIFNRKTADDSENIDRLRRASGVFLSGGDQRRLQAAMVGTDLLEGLHELYRRGGVVAGTSAGAAVMSDLMITGDELKNQDPDYAFETIEAGNMETWEGFRLLPETIVDQHFVVRRRHNRLLSLVLEHPSLLGIGIDESTAIEVGPPDRFRVIGESQIVIYDAAGADVDRDEAGLLSGAGVVTHVLTPGAGYDLRNRRPLP